MKVYLFCIADPYSTQGWCIHAVQESDTWALKHNIAREDAFLMHKMDLIPPAAEELVKIGMARVDEMNEEVVEQLAASKQRIKEFESKFLALEAPMDVEELS